MQTARVHLPLLLATLTLSTHAFATSTTFKPAKHTVVAVSPADASTIKRAISAERGHVVVVNFWATWCEPCVAEFPDLVKFEARYRKKGVMVMAVSADMRKDIAGKVQPFVTKQHATFPQFLQVSNDPEDFINAFDTTWQGDLPRTFIYDKSGKLVKSLSGQHTMKDFAAAVDPLLK